MAKMKLMLMPSARSKFVKEENMNLIYKSLLVLSAFMVLQNYYLYSFMHGIKLVLIIVIAIYVTVESEILFYSHDKDIDRQTAKGLIKKSYPKITALIYALLIPIGTPLWLVLIGAILATFLGKLLFGGFAHMVFHSSLVGVMFVTRGWPQLGNSVNFTPSIINDILQILFDNKFFNETLSIGSLFDPLNYQTALANVIGSGTLYDIFDVILGTVPGIVGSGLIILLIFGFLLVKKAVNWVTPVTLLGSFLVTASIIGIATDKPDLFPIYQLFSGSLLFVTIFVVTDPITTPIPTAGKVVFGVIAGALAMFIRNGTSFEEGIVFGVLFMMMLTPMLNAELKKKKKPAPKKKVVKEEV